jgi:long-chain acyl-CoA synthetase
VGTARPSIASQAATVCRAFAATARAFAERPALRSVDGDIAWTWADYAAAVRDVAAGLSGLGLKRGDTVACWLANRPEFHVLDLAAQHLGAAAFAIHPTHTAEDAEHILGDLRTRIVVAEEATIARARTIRAARRTAVKTIVVVEGVPGADVLSWPELLGCAPGRFELEWHTSAVEPNDLAALIYTSGSTGPPQCVSLTHEQVMAQVAELSDRLGVPDGLWSISWLPTASVVERLVTHYLPIVHGWQVTTCGDAQSIASVLAEVDPKVIGFWHDLGIRLGEL